MDTRKGIKMITKVIGIDLGTKSIKIYKKNKGIILTEHNLIAQDNKKNIVAAGDEAFEMLEKAPNTYTVSYPVRNGVIADFDNMIKLLNLFLKKVNCTKSFLSKNMVYISVPCDISEVEKRAIFDLVSHSNASIKKTYLIDKPIAAALGAGIDVLSPEGNMVIDIGGDTTEVSVISLGGIVRSSLIPTGGNIIDEGIKNIVKKHYNVLIGSRTAEQVKIKLASAVSEDNRIKIYGRDVVSGLPKQIEIESDLIKEAIKEHLKMIIETVRLILEKTPPELSADIIDRGIYLVGGGALLNDLNELIYKETNLKVILVDDPSNSVIRGVGKIVEKPQLYERLISVPHEKYKYN